MENICNFPYLPGAEMSPLYRDKVNSIRARNSDVFMDGSSTYIFATLFNQH